MKTIIVTGANGSNIRLLAASRAGEDLNLGHGVQYPKLDISSSESIKALAQHVVDKHGKVDVLINNAGVNRDNNYSPENAKQTLDVNYRGTLEMCQTFLPLLTRPGGRIINLSSVGSTLKPYATPIQSIFRSQDLTLQDLEILSQEFQSTVSSHTESDSGFAGPGRSYSFSKACVNAFTRILAKDNPDVLVNCCCPGWVRTDMGQLIGKPPKTVEDGAKIPVRLAMADIGDVSGEYWANGSVRSKEEGEVQQWYL
ncbi:hypothetical protein LTR37_015878 [Vermiconidia calcicola]|uniref:Uncharacterized protein n=1 Tax=Vermiconidia calcicola TaxID=1690605 RepID=A0ACC3MS59_9PEZI|nr:hypothetical protein LTR37_015878 [Vermiconidia calcicola]